MDQRSRELPHGWALSDVASVGEVRLGRQRSPEKQTGKHPCKYLRAANITPDGIDVDDVLEMDFTAAERETYKLRPGDIVLTEASGSATQVGRAAIWQGQIATCCYQNTVVRFRPRLVTTDFAFTVFRHFAMSGRFAAVARGVGIQHLGVTRFASMEFPLPPLAEQRRITAEVDRRTLELREARAVLSNALANIKEQNKEILAAAVAGKLVESEAALAQREGRAYESGRSLLVRATTSKADHPTMFEPAIDTRALGVDHKPPGWAYAKVGDVGEARLGKSRSPTSQHGSHMRPYLRVANVHEDRIDVSSILEMNFEPEEYERYSLRHGDILLNDGQSPELVGRPAIYRDEVPGASFQNHLIRFRAGNAIFSEFALLVFRHYLHSGVFTRVARWTTNIATLSQGRFSSLPIPVPPLNEQRRIVQEARARLDKSAAQEASVLAALDRLPSMEAELLATAIAGALVPQDSRDEPASVLLTQQHGTDAGADEPPSLVSEEVSADMPANTGPAPTRTVLAAVARAAGRPLRLPDLLRAAGYDRESTEDVELFYLALRKEIGHTLRRIGEDAENDLVEAIPDAAQ